MNKFPFALLLVMLAGCAVGPGKTAETVPPNAIVIFGRYFDGLGQVVERGVIVIAEGRIVCAGQAQACPTEGAARYIEVDEGTILPGLIDLHVHTRPHYTPAFPAAGVTTVRDANNTLELITSMRAQPGAPRILASGPVLDGKDSVITQMSETAGRPGEQPWQTIMPVLVDDARDAETAVQALAKEGVDVIKLFEQVPAEAYAAAVAAAKQEGLPVMTDLGLIGTRGLNGAEVDALQAARLKVTSIEHLSGFALAYQRLGGDPLAEDLDEALLDRIADEFAATGVAVVPTLANTEHFAAAAPLDVSGIPLADVAQTYIAGFWEQLHGYAASEDRRHRALAEQRLTRALMRRLVERGVLIGAGTDTPAAPFTVPGGGIHQELAYLVDYGLTPAAALRAATGDAARILGRDDLGVICEGAVADLVAVDGDPLADITATRRLLWVMQQGVLSSPEELRQGAEQAVEAFGQP